MPDPSGARDAKARLQDDGAWSSSPSTNRFREAGEGHVPLLAARAWNGEHQVAVRDPSWLVHEAGDACPEVPRAPQHIAPSPMPGNTSRPFFTGSPGAARVRQGG